MTDYEKVMDLIKHAKVIMSDGHEMRADEEKYFDLKGTKNTQIKMHKILYKWLCRVFILKRHNRLSDAEYALREKVYYMIYYSINAMTIE